MREGECLVGTNITSAPPAKRAAELTRFLLDDSVHMVFPPWGGELAIDLLPLLDFKQLERSTPKWFVGYSDVSTLMLPYTMLTGIATMHGCNFMDSPFQIDAPLLPWHLAAGALPGSALTQGRAPLFQKVFTRFEEKPDVAKYALSEPAAWKILGSESDPAANVRVQGRLIGGCLEVLSMLPGTPYGDVNRFAREYAPEGLLVYLEVAETSAPYVNRMLWHLRLAGWFDNATGILLGRSAGTDMRNYTQRQAIVDALGTLDIPVIYDMDIGHTPPQAMLINGALATVRTRGGDGVIEQVLV